MFRSILTVTLLLALVLVVPAVAQEQTGAVNGTATDESGAALPGALCKISGPRLPAGLETITDASGKYRFPAVPPGEYELTCGLDGFADTKVAGIDVSLGSILTINLEMKLSEVEETIVVTSEAPVIEITQSATATSISGDLIENLPRGRNFTSVVTQAAHAADEDAARGISIDGASGAENRFIVDGIDTTDMQSGLSGKNVRTDMVQEVQVKSSGYMAEYGAATGGVINVVTKSGGNRFKGDVGVYYTSNDLNGDQRDTLRRNPTTGNAEFVNLREDSWDQVEPGFTIGGPILRDKLWFFVGFLPRDFQLDRTIDYSGTRFSEAGEQTFTNNDETDYFSANLSGNPRKNLSFKVGANYSDFFDDNLLPSRNATDDPSSNFDIDFKRPNRSISGHVDWLVNKNLAVSSRVGQFREDAREFGVSSDIWKQFSTSSDAAPGELFPQMPIELQQPIGFRTIPTNSATAIDLFKREAVSSDANWFLSDFGGEHSIKVGVQLENVSNDVLDGYQNTRHLYEWGNTRVDLNGNPVTGTFGVLRVLQIATQGTSENNNVGLFVQDSWQPTKRLTLNLGLRAEDEEVPSFAAEANIPDPAISFDFSDKIAPRLGFAYDVKGDGKTKVYGSYGIFYDVTKLEMPRGSLGGDKWVDFFFGLETLDWTSINCTISPANSIEEIPDCGENNFLFAANRRVPANDPNEVRIDPNLKPMESVEFTVGVEHQLGSRTSLGLRFVHKEIERTIEDVGVVVPGLGEEFFIANPGEGIAEQQLGPDFPRQPRAVRDYDGIELDYRMRNRNWMVHASYLYSKLWGNYSGLANSDEVSTASGLGRASPNVNRVFDALPSSFDSQGNAVFGRLGTDRPHQFKAQVIYHANWGTSFGLNQYIGSGTPITTELSVTPGNPFFPNGRGDLGRTPDLSSTDLYIAHDIDLTERYSIEVSVNVLNLFDEDTPVQIWNSQALEDLPLSNEEFFAGFDSDQVIADEGVRIDPRFGQATVFQSRRSMRFNIRFRF